MSRWNSSPSSDPVRRWYRSLRGAILVWLAFCSVPAEADQAAEDVVRLTGLSGTSAATVVIARESAAIAGSSSESDPAVIDARLRRAEAYRDQGYLQEAAKDASDAASAARMSNDSERLARALGIAGTIAYAAGRTDAAREVFAESLELASSNGYHALEAATLLNIGNLSADKDRQQAVDAYTAAARHAEELGLPAIAAQAHLSLARLAFLTIKNNEIAAAHLDQAKSQIALLPTSNEHGKQLLVLGVLNRDIADNSFGDRKGEATQALTAAAAIGHQLGDMRLQSEAWGELAELATREDERDRALDRAREALRWARAAEASDLAYRWQRQIGRLRAAGGDVAGALAAYHDAVEALRPLRAEIAAATSVGGSDFRETLAAIYQEYTALLFQQADQATDAQASQILLAEARRTLEQFRSAELENYFQNECIAALQAQTRAIDQGTDGAAIVYTIVFPDRLVLLISAGQNLRHYSVDVDASSLRRLVERLRLSVSAPVLGETGIAQQLYDLLVRPMEEVLHTEKIDTLVIVPDGFLRLVPWAALHDGTTYLGDRLAIAVTPSFELINPKSMKKIHPLLAALTRAPPPLQSLRFVEEEIRRIQKLFPATTVLKDQAFVRSQLESSLNATPYSVVHIASHARFGQSAKDSFIVAYNERLDMNALEQAISPTRFREEPVELVVLSACDTAIGDEQAALGLAGVAFKAGARSALASLWRADDRAASELVIAFYRELAAGQSKAQALQSAQRHVRTVGGMEHPYFWAPFILIGNWL